ncbi:NACHT domain-containing protein [Thioflexithrix psekupsensis]|uniref:NACHT domain-containing protein n=1 Tax=Thioflexithrix psekupsensis TaxID=1570016 RepID=UPI00112368CC|nr:NACHT domain-containing protein [Thioflexithrix psekupsensis]
MADNVDNLLFQIHERLLDYYDSIFTHNNPKQQLPECRKFAEAFCRYLYVKKNGKQPDGKPTLENYLGSKSSPDRPDFGHLENPLRTIQGYGNFGIHDQDKSKEITNAFIKPALEAVRYLMQWHNEELSKEWFEKYGFEIKNVYLNGIIKQCSTIRILGHHEPVPLEGIFTDVFVLDKPSAQRRYDISKLTEDPAFLEKTPRSNGLELVKNQSDKRLFILGKPGAGKTTFLKYIALQAAQGKIDKLPIFVSLKEWADSGLDLQPFLNQQFVACGIPHNWQFIDVMLRMGEMIVLFDGLDEVQESGGIREKINQQLKQFSKDYLNSTCLISCRNAASDYTFDYFVYTEIADFTEAQIKAYAKKWFSGEKVAKRDKFFTAFQQEEHKGLRELARTPLLLSLLCLAFDDTMNFPSRRLELYEEAVDALLKKWDASRAIQRDVIYKGLSLGRKRQLLATIAALNFDKGNYFIAQKSLEQQLVHFLQKVPEFKEQEIEGERVLKSIEAQHGLLIERAKSIYSFSHLTIQEFFTAKYIAENPSQIKALIPHYHEPRWREVFLLTVSLLSEEHSTQFFKDFQDFLRQSVISDAPELAKLLSWATRKASKIQSGDKSADVRVVYILLGVVSYRTLNRVHYRVLDRVLDRVPDRVLAKTIDRIIVLAITRTRASDRILAINCDFDRGRAFARDLARASARDLARDLDLARAPALIRDLAINLVYKADYFISIILLHCDTFAEFSSQIFPELREQQQEWTHFFKEFVELCKTSPDYYAELSKLKLPDENSSTSEWQEFTAQFRQLSQKHQDIGYRWQLTEEQFDKLATYLKDNLFLLECLKLAMVEDRQAIEDQLLYFPEESGKLDL